MRKQTPIFMAIGLSVSLFYMWRRRVNKKSSNDIPSQEMEQLGEMVIAEAEELQRGNIKSA